MYVVGCNDKGQLGVGDTEPRTQFTAIQGLRGCNINFVTAGADCVFAINEEHDVYVWGGGGVAKTGIHYVKTAVDVMLEEQQAKKIAAASGHKGKDKAADKNAKKPDAGAAAKANWMEPQTIKDFTGEEIVAVSVGSSHCMACGKGGDCFVWGDGDVGQLGLGAFEHSPLIAINNSFPGIKSVTAGGNHSAVLVSESNGVYMWGHGGNGRLGIGAWERVGVEERVKSYFPIPTILSTLEVSIPPNHFLLIYVQTNNLPIIIFPYHFLVHQHLYLHLQPVKIISCGADHTLAYGHSGVWSWGNGSGGKLGLGDEKDRSSPNLVPRLKGRSVSMLIASTWYVSLFMYFCICICIRIFILFYFIFPSSILCFMLCTHNLGIV